ncbi:MAG TPA: hydroxymethylbilane synthase [Mycobacteriales bacterium]|jgi:hydroxymethylbilane synthase|nr:hydroxymethylbilane synthase [Mycobacteriales bacterium]
MTATVQAPTLRLGTRRSALALAQAGSVADALRADGHDVRLVEVVTEGDRSAEALTTLGGTGVFVAELRQRLLAGDIDLAVHSLKDLPTAPAPGLVVAAIPPRADPRDALVSRDGLALAELPAGAVVGTGSPRRAAQLHATGLGLSVVPIRGNVDTRLRKVADGEVDAVVVAAAGLVRLGRLDDASEVLDPAQMLPAPGQGALAVECRSGDDSLRTILVTALDDDATRAAATAERIVLARLEAGCSAPVGALADIGDGDEGLEIYLRAAVVAVDGSRALRLSITGPVAQSDELAIRLAAQMLEEGAADLIGENP